MKREGEREGKREGCGGRWREEQEKQSEILFGELNGHNYCHWCLCLQRPGTLGGQFHSPEINFCPAHNIADTSNSGTGEYGEGHTKAVEENNSQPNPN